MTRVQGRARWAASAHSHAFTRAKRYLRLADSFARAARKKRDPSLLELAWSYLRLAADAVARLPEPST